MSTIRSVSVEYRGHYYAIPEMWLVGASSTFGGYLSAIRQWHEQALMEEAFKLEEFERKEG